MDHEAVIVCFRVKAVGKTKVACEELLDNLSAQFQDHVGGAPWIAVGDNVYKAHSPDALISDDQGFVYMGERELHFQGPMVEHAGLVQHDGSKVQNVWDK